LSSSSSSWHHHPDNHHQVLRGKNVARQLQILTFQTDIILLPSVEYIALFTYDVCLLNSDQKMDSDDLGEDLEALLEAELDKNDDGDM